MPAAAVTEPGATLRVTEIFHSIQGESSRVGLPTVFVRLTGCPLRCVWCDTEYAFSGGELLGIADIVQRVAGLLAEFKNDGLIRDAQQAGDFLGGQDLGQLPFGRRGFLGREISLVVGHASGLPAD